MSREVSEGAERKEKKSKHDKKNKRSRTTRVASSVVLEPIAGSDGNDSGGRGGRDGQADHSDSAEVFVSLPLTPSVSLVGALDASGGGREPVVKAAVGVEIVSQGDFPDTDHVTFHTAAVLISAKSVPGDLFLTNAAIWFKAKQGRPLVMWKIQWTNVKQITKGNKKGYDKVLVIGTPCESVTFGTVRDRSSFISASRIIQSVLTNSVKSYGFAKRDDTEVSRRINVLKAPHVFEDSVRQSLADVIRVLREETIIYDMLTACGCINIGISQWSKTKNGIQRIIQYVQPMWQNAEISGIQTLMTSGQVCVCETTTSSSRSAIGKFLETNSQFSFKEEEGVVKIRGAYGLTWLNDPWDKEFVDAAVSRVNRMSFYYLKNRFSGESFEVTKYEGEWRMHQPFVLVIVGLVILILLVIILPIDTNWYSMMAAAAVLVLFFYM